MRFTTKSIDCLSSSSFWLPNKIVPSAWIEHAPFAFWLMDAMLPSCLVELGTHHGFSYLTFCQAVKQLEIKSVCYAIDSWKGDEHAGFYGEEVFAELKAYHDKLYSSFSTLIRSTFEDCCNNFQEGSIDVLHLDGRHFYEDVKHDVGMWLPKCSNKAILLLHDTQVRERGFGVWKVWQALSSQYKSFEFPHGHGLGVVAVGPNVTERIEPLFSANEREVHQIRSIYARLGAAISTDFELSSNKIELEKRKIELEQKSSENVSLNNKSRSIKRELESTRALLLNNELTRTQLIADLKLAEARIAELNLEKTQLLSDLVMARKKNASIIESTSWKITAPGRWFSKQLKLTRHKWGV